MEGLGVHSLWGTTPAVDLCAGNEAAMLEVLVVGAGDVRHVVRTLAENCSSSKARRLRLYLLDMPVETLARHLLLLSIVLDFVHPIRQRANTFLEVFGNCRVQERTSKHIAELAARILRFVSDGEGPLKGLVDLSHLRHRDVDALEVVLKSWGDTTAFDVERLREDRVRALHGQRYDSRVGQVDWDYQQGIKPQASIVHFKQYRAWRETGVAFEFGDQEYTKPNRSMASYAKGKQQGLSKLRRGFWGDVQVGPYFAFGLECAETNQHAADLFQVLNRGTGTEQHRHTAVHVAVFNLVSWMHEIETGTPYKMTKPHDVYSGLQRPVDPAAYATQAAHSVMGLKERASVTLLTGDSFQAVLGKKDKYAAKFHFVWLSNHHAHLVADPILRKVCAPTAAVAVESARNMVMVDTEQRLLLATKVASLAASAGFRPAAAPVPAALVPAAPVPAAPVPPADPRPTDDDQQIAACARPGAGARQGAADANDFRASHFVLTPV